MGRRGVYNPPMKNTLVLLCAAALLGGAGMRAFAGDPRAGAVTRVAAGAPDQLAALLNKPAMVKPAEATGLGKGWTQLETDAHVFTDQVTLAQVAAVLGDSDFSHQAVYYNGKKSKLAATAVGPWEGGTLVDFVSTSIAGLIKVNTPYRAVVTRAANTPTKIAMEVVQVDSDDNKDIKNLFASRYAEEIALGGKKYVYIRIYTIDEVNSSILPKSILASGAPDVNVETLNLIIAAAKGK